MTRTSRTPRGIPCRRLTRTLGFPRSDGQFEMPLERRWHPLRGRYLNTRPSRKTRPQPSTSVPFLLSLLSTVLTPLREPMIARTRPA
jgi:hypothetical protein